MANSLGSQASRRLANAELKRERERERGRDISLIDVNRASEEACERRKDVYRGNYGNLPAIFYGKQKNPSGIRSTGAMTTAASFHPRNRSFVIENSCTIALAASGRDLFALDLALLARVQRGTSRRYIPSSFVVGSSLTNPFK